MAKDKAEGKKEGNWKKWIGRLGLVLVACSAQALLNIITLHFTDGKSPLYVVLGLSFSCSLCATAISCIIAGFQEKEHNTKLAYLQRKNEGITSVKYEGDLVTLIIKDDGLSVVTKGTEQQIFDGEVNTSPFRCYSINIGPPARRLYIKKKNSIKGGINYHEKSGSSRRCSCWFTGFFWCGILHKS